MLLNISLIKYAFVETATREKKQLTDVRKTSHIFVNDLSTKLKVKAFTITFDQICRSLNVYLHFETETCHDFDINQHG